MPHGNIIMKKPLLFLLRANSRADRPEGWYCPDCALVEGVLGYYPQLRTAIDVRYVDFGRPRQPIVELIGEQHQDSPCLLLDATVELPDGLLLQDAPVINGWRVISENTKLLLDALPLLAMGVGRTGTGSFFQDP